MKLNHGLHLAYCTNIHRGETWPETFAALQQYTLAVRDRISPGNWYAIGLRLSDRASRELGDKKALLEFRRWLEVNHARGSELWVGFFGKAGYFLKTMSSACATVSE